MRPLQGPQGCPCQFDYDDNGFLWRTTDEDCPWHSDSAWVNEALPIPDVKVEDVSW